MTELKDGHDIIWIRKNKAEAEAQIQWNKNIIIGLKQKVDSLKVENTFYSQCLKSLEKEKKLFANELSYKKDLLNKWKETSLLGEHDTSNKDNKYKISKILELYNQPTYWIIDKLRSEYQSWTANVKEIFKTEKETLLIEEHISLYVQFQNYEFIPYKVVDDYFCYIDWFNEVCNFHDVEDRSQFIFLDPFNNQVNPLFSVRGHLQFIKEKLKEVPKFRIVPIKEDIHVEEETKKNLNEKDENIVIKKEEIITGGWWTNIAFIEDEVILKIKKIVFYIIFMCVLFAAVFGNLQIEDRYRLRKAFTDETIDKAYYQSDIHRITKSFNKINDIQDIRSWFINSFWDIFNYPDKIYQDDNSVEKNTTIIMSTWYIIGLIRVIALSPFDDEYKWSDDKYWTLYSDYWEILRKRNDFSVAYKGVLKEYSESSSYYTDIPATSKSCYLLFSLLNNIGIISKQKLDLLLLRINAYNNNKKYLASISIGFELTPNGYIRTSYNICAVLFIREWITWQQFNFSIELLFFIVYYLVVIIYTGYQIYSIIFALKLGYNNIPYSSTLELAPMNSNCLKCLKRIGNVIYRFFTAVIEYLSFWRLINWITVIWYILSISLRLSIYLIFTLKNYDLSKNEFYDTYSWCTINETLTVIDGLMCIFTLVYLLNYVDEEIVKNVFSTIRSSFLPIMKYVISFSFTVVGYALFLYLIYGVRIIGLNDLLKSVIYVFMMIFGDFNLMNDMLSHYEVITIIFGLLFSITFFVLYANWLSGIIFKGYFEYWKGVEQKEPDKIFENIDVVWAKFKRSLIWYLQRTKKMWKGIMRRRQRRDNNGERDENNEKLIEMKEVKSKMKENDSDNEEVEIEEEFEEEVEEEEDVKEGEEDENENRQEMKVVEVINDKEGVNENGDVNDKEEEMRELGWKDEDVKTGDDILIENNRSKENEKKIGEYKDVIQSSNNTNKGKNKSKKK